MKKILFNYCLILSLFVTVSGFITSKNNTLLILQMVFLPVTLYFVFTFITDILRRNPYPDKNANSRMTFLITFVFFMFLLVSSGLKIYENIKHPKVQNKPSVKKASVNINNTKTYVILKTTGIKNDVNIFSQATDSAQIIGTAVTGHQYEMITKNGAYFEIRLDSGSSGFVSDKFAEIKH